MNIDIKLDDSIKGRDSMTSYNANNIYRKWFTEHNLGYIRGVVTVTLDDEHEPLVCKFSYSPYFDDGDIIRVSDHNDKYTLSIVKHAVIAYCHKMCYDKEFLI